MNQLIHEEFVQKIDWQLAEQGFPLSSRPLEVAIRWQEDNGMLVDLYHPINSEIYDLVIEIYKKLYPNDHTSIGILSGGVVIQDRMYQVNLPIIYGQVPINPISLINIPKETLDFVFKNYPQQGWKAFYGVCDLIDLGYGIDDLKKMESPASDFLLNLSSHINAIAQILLSQDNIESVIQNTCVVAELSMKAALLHLGYTQEHLKSSFSHNLNKLSTELTKLRSERSDAIFIEECNKFPNYVNSRYEFPSLNRLELMSLAMRTQFVAAEAIRRITDRHMAWDLEMERTIPARPF